MNSLCTIKTVFQLKRSCLLRNTLMFLFLFLISTAKAQVADLIIEKTGPVSVVQGQVFNYTLDMYNNGPAAVTNATFNDNLPVDLSNATFVSCNATGGATCPVSYNISNTNVSGTIPNLPSGGRVVFVFSVTAPMYNSYTSISNTATISCPSGITEANPLTNSSTFNTSIPIKLLNTDIIVEKTNSPTNTSSSSWDCSTLPKTINYSVKWINAGNKTLNGILLFDYMNSGYSCTAGTGNCGYFFPFGLNNISWYASSGTTLPSSTFNILSGSDLVNQNISLDNTYIGTWEAGDTIILTYSITISPQTVSGCGGNITWNFKNNAFFGIPNTSAITDTVSNNNKATVTNYFACTGNTPCTTGTLQPIDLVTTQLLKEHFGTGCGQFPIRDTIEAFYVNKGPVAIDSFLININSNLTFNSFNGASYGFIKRNWHIESYEWGATGNTAVPPISTYFIANSNLTGYQQFGYQFEFNGHPWFVNDTIKFKYVMVYDSLDIPYKNCLGYITYKTLFRTYADEREGGLDEIYGLGSNNDDDSGMESQPIYTNDLAITKTVNPNVVNDMGTMTMETIFQNAGLQSVSPAIFRDTIPASFQIDISSFTCVPLAAGSACGTYNWNPDTRILEYTIPNMSSGSSVKITYSGIINSYGLSLTDSTSAYAFVPCYDCVLASNRAKTNYQVKGTLNSLGDYVWFDKNNNGVQDTDEYGVSGISVSLFNAGTDGIQFTLDDKYIDGAISDAYGYYKFIGLENGNYYVKFSLTPNFIFTIGNSDDTNSTNSDVNPNTGFTGLINLNSSLTTGGEQEYDVDCGITKPNLQNYYNIGDYAWLDNNKDGIFDDGTEPALNGITVTLYSQFGTPLASTKTNHKGYYLFTNVEADKDYYIHFSLPPGLSYTSQVGILDDELNSDANPLTGNTAEFTLGYEDKLTIDVGFYIDPKSSLGNYVWTDSNHDGIQNEFEPGIANITMNLYSLGADGMYGGTGTNADSLIKSTITDINGYYLFDNLDAGKYFVSSTLPIGYTITLNNIGNDLLDNDFKANSLYPNMFISDIYTLLTNQDYLGVDMGIQYQLIPGTLCLGNYVWWDYNEDGIQNDGNQSGVPDVLVNLLDNNGDLVYNPANALPYTSITDKNGYYEFCDIEPNLDYKVKFANLPFNSSFTKKDAINSNDENDSDVNSGNFSTDVFNLSANKFDLDAGLLPYKNSLTSSLGNLVWYDVNNNGKQDLGEYGVPNVKVLLYKDLYNDGIIDMNDLASPLDTTYTDLRGNYIFTNLTAGAYQVKFDISTFPTGYTLQSGKQDVVTAGDLLDSDASPTTGFTGTYNIFTGEDNMTVDAGIYNTSATNSIGNFIWFDSNLNGIQDSGESGVHNIPINLYNATNNELLATTTTNNSGNYLFSNLPNGEYYLKIALYNGYKMSSRNAGSDDLVDSDFNPLLYLSDNITLTGNTFDVSIDGGIFTVKAALGDYTWFDNNKDGIQGVTENALPGVLVSLKKISAVSSGSNPLSNVAYAITDANGKYYFPNLEPTNATNILDYLIGFEDIPNGTDFTIFETPNTSIELDNNALGYYSSSVTLEKGEINLTLDAGVIPFELGKIGDYVWFDSNMDGIRDANEQAVPGILVTLYYYGGGQIEYIGAAVTDENGSYLFTEVYPHEYIINFSNLPAGASFTLQNQGVSETYDSDADENTGFSNVFSLIGSEKIWNIDAGITLYQPLPIELISFKGTAKNCKVALEWKTSTETNFHGFELERKIGNGNFEKIAFILAKGSNSIYKYEDITNEQNVSYRLKFIDIDGTNSGTSNILIFNNPCSNKLIGSILAYPNPVISKYDITLEYTSEFAMKNVEITLVDELGKIVERKLTDIEVGTNLNYLSTKVLSSGNYTIILRHSDKKIANPIKVSILK